MLGRLGEGPEWYMPVSKSTMLAYKLTGIDNYVIALPASIICPL